MTDRNAVSVDGTPAGVADGGCPGVESVENAAAEARLDALTRWARNRGRARDEHDVGV